MQFDSAHRASRTVAELAQDVWQKRHKLVSDTPIFLPYRLSVSDHTLDVDVNFYIHVVIDRERWVYLISYSAPWDITADEIIRYEQDYRDTDDFDWDIRGESYRHYMFSDCLQPAVLRKIETVQAGLGAPESPYLWDTFPIDELPKNVEKVSVSG